MSKRSWSVANAAQGLLDMNAQGHRQSSLAPFASPTQSALPQDSMTPPDRSGGPQISRKVKACAACRKQKIKCLMDNGEPPCRRCIERNLSCVLNKSLQTLISEGSMWKDDMHRDLHDMHSAIQDVLKRLSMPPIPPLRAYPADEEERSPVPEPPRQAPSKEKSEPAAPSIDSSPKIVPRHNESVQSVPIETLYQITRLRSLRSEAAGDGPPKEDASTSDIISKGIIPLEDAERLTTLYLKRLDHFAYSIVNKFTNLQSIRKRSPKLTAAICTVSALHDPQSDRFYEPCLEEFKKLLSDSMFNRRVDRESLRAMCIGAFWLSDISWTLSGHAIRRAMAISLNANYHRLLAEPSEDAIDCLRLWYFLYICDQHLSILYGRTTIIRREETSIQGTSRYLESPAATEQDRRIASQVSLLVIMGNARQFFGRDMGGMLAPSAVEHISHFNAQLDDWMQTWMARLQRNDLIGDFPARGCILHYNLAKLHLHSHVFRGLADSPVPPHFQNSAVMAVQAATQIFELLLTDVSLRDGLVGMPHYTHTMIAFACGFLLQVTAKYDGVFVNPATVHDLIGRLVEQLRSMPTGSWHLVRLLVEGLEKMTKASLRTRNARSVAGYAPPTTQMNNGQMTNGSGMAPSMDYMPRPGDFGMGQQPDPFTMPDFGMSSSFLPFEDVNSLFRSSDLGYL